MLTWASWFLVLSGLVVIVESDDVVKNYNTDTNNEDNEKIVYPSDIVMLQRATRFPRTSNRVYQNHNAFPPGFQHNPDFHRTHGDFPTNFHHHHHTPNFHNQVMKDNGREEIAMRNDPHETSFDNTSTEIPLDFIRNISKYSISDILHNFVEGNVEFEEPLLSSRFGAVEGTARNAASFPEKAGCIPEYRTYRLIDDNDPSILFIPQCTRVEQCGGCCSHPLLSCQPIEKETITYKVMKLQYTMNKKLKFLGNEVILVEKHTKCQCSCKVKEENCNKYQAYNPGDCKCACKNVDEEEKCHRNSEIKLWNPDICACECRDILQCSTGSYFDQNKCKCLITPMKSTLATYEVKVDGIGADPAGSPYKEGN